jgi:hypothetical protein
MSQRTIKKGFRKVNGSGLRKPYFTRGHIAEINAEKGKIRSEVETTVAPEESGVYDDTDLLADMANALLDFMNGLTTSTSIEKFKTRQTAIKAIVAKYKTV